MHRSAESRGVFSASAASHTRRRWMLGAFVFVLLMVSALFDATTTRAEAPTPGVKLYVFDLGWLKARDPKVLTDRGVNVTDMSVAGYLIVHPRGTLLWDAGTILDAQVKPEGTTVARATVNKTLAGQLAEIGYKPSDITYLALSHMHYDHSANANAYAGSTWLVQRPERAAMFPEPPQTNTIVEPDVVEKFSALKTAKTKILDGDYDVFGDGSVVIISTPGHTPGHQSLFLRLAKYGPLLLSGDLYHYPAERTLHDFLPFAGRGNDAQEAVSKAKVEALVNKEGATLWIQHDIINDKHLNKSPAFYD